MSEFRVSIFMLTYNQEEFISNTIDSVLMQRTNFPYQLVIGEDGSTDKTADICKEYAQKNSGKIKLLSRKTNLGLIHNFVKTYEACDGDYVAILDGDDYWTDPLKLQKQVDFLDSHPNHSIVFTGFKKLYSKGTLVSKNYSGFKETTDFTDLVNKNYICSATVMFRNKSSQEDFPKWIDEFPYGDWPLYLWKTKNGEKIGFLPDETAIYRMEIGVSEKLKLTHSDIVEVNLGILRCVTNDKNFKKYRNEIKKSLKSHSLQFMSSLFRERKFKKSFSESSKLFFSEPLRVIRTYLFLIRRIYFN